MKISIEFISKKHEVLGTTEEKVDNFSCVDPTTQDFNNKELLKRIGEEYKEQLNHDQPIKVIKTNGDKGEIDLENVDYFTVFTHNLSKKVDIYME
ncbi:hypothetical protein [Tetragenococcus halophilus]|uniref:Uncharacterized protein n=1 Tax=Tetragenococcus halophilus (strain DSM 20338 / JCM 20259 / NCIMB 9735 / NBRC 12172) TaxID=945021 RepID=A0AAN1VSB3_TETHN|nr:hypothetical protein [Tetragenococcus halophilus]BAK95116.1 hypothetical protein TEH_17890 [Tetragenococcus halophilus NBRC 12172]GBD71140.1 putative uncharacterized protein [Tetragenococcus halophilus subsp. halophilus]